DAQSSRVFTSELLDAPATLRERTDHATDVTSDHSSLLREPRQADLLDGLGRSHCLADGPNPVTGDVRQRQQDHAIAGVGAGEVVQLRVVDAADRPAPTAAVDENKVPVTLGIFIDPGDGGVVP